MGRALTFTFCFKIWRELKGQYVLSSKWRLLWKAEGEIFLTFNKGLSTYDPLRYGKYL